MSVSTESPSLTSLLQNAVGEYQHTRIKLVEHPLAKKLENCDSAESVRVTAILQAVREFRGSNDKVMRLIKHAVHILHAFSTNGAFGGWVRWKGLVGTPCLLQPFQPAKAIFAGIGILLAVCVFSQFLHANFWKPDFIRQSRTLVQATMRSSTCSNPSKTSSTAWISIPRSRLHQP